MRKNSNTHVNDEVETKHVLQILVVSGLHGNEHSAILCSHYLEDLIGRRSFADNVKFAHAVNMTGIKKNTRDFFKDEENTVNDLNRLFSSEELTQSKDEVIDGLKEQIAQADIVIDIHNSPNCSNFFLVDLNDSYKAKLSFVASENFADCVFRYSPADTLKKYVNSFEDKLGFTYEFKGMDIDSIGAAFAADQLASFIENICSKNYSSIREFDKPAAMKDHEFLIGEKISYHGISTPEYKQAYSSLSGIFIPVQSSEQFPEVTKGSVIGKIISGDKYEWVQSPVTGKVVAYESVYVKSGNPICVIQEKPAWEEIQLYLDDLYEITRQCKVVVQPSDCVLNALAKRSVKVNVSEIVEGESFILLEIDMLFPDCIKSTVLPKSRLQDEDIIRDTNLVKLNLNGQFYLAEGAFK